jgi:hypothetical protein
LLVLEVVPAISVGPKFGKMNASLAFQLVLSLVMRRLFHDIDSRTGHSLNEYSSAPSIIFFSASAIRESQPQPWIARSNSHLASPWEQNDKDARYPAATTSSTAFFGPCQKFLEANDWYKVSTTPESRPAIFAIGSWSDTTTHRQRMDRLQVVARRISPSALLQNHRPDFISCSEHPLRL